MTEYMTTKEAAAYLQGLGLRVSHHRLNSLRSGERHLRHKTFRHVEIGGRIFYSKALLDEDLARHVRGKAEPVVRLVRREAA